MPVQKRSLPPSNLSQPSARHRSSLFPAAPGEEERGVTASTLPPPSSIHVNLFDSCATDDSLLSGLPLPEGDGTSAATLSPGARARAGSWSARATARATVTGRTKSAIRGMAPPPGGVGAHARGSQEQAGARMEQRGAGAGAAAGGPRAPLGGLPGTGANAPPEYRATNAALTPPTDWHNTQYMHTPPPPLHVPLVPRPPSSAPPVFFGAPPSTLSGLALPLPPPAPPLSPPKPMPPPSGPP